MFIAEQGVLNAFPTIPRKPFSLVCPYCGCTHRLTRKCILLAAVVVVMALTLVLNWRPGMAETTFQTGQPDHLIGLRREFPPRSTSIQVTPFTLTATSLPTSTPTLTPTPLPIPKTGVIWNQENAGSYFWEAPGKGITTVLPNGTIVTFLEDWQAYGGLGWTAVEFDGQAGWVDVVDVYRVTIPEGGFSQVVAAEGTNLYSRPQGHRMIGLSPGTPVRLGGEMQVVDGLTWVQVILLDGTKGWMKEQTIGD